MYKELIIHNFVMSRVPCLSRFFFCKFMNKKHYKYKYRTLYGNHVTTQNLNISLFFISVLKILIYIYIPTLFIRIKKTEKN